MHAALDILFTFAYRHTSLSSYTYEELLNALFVDTDVFKKALYDTETGRYWSASRRLSVAQDFKRHVLVELKRRNPINALG